MNALGITAWVSLMLLATVSDHLSLRSSELLIHDRLSTSSLLYFLVRTFLPEFPVKMFLVRRLFGPPTTHNVLQGASPVIPHNEEVTVAFVHSNHPDLLHILSMYVLIGQLSRLQSLLAQRVTRLGALLTGYGL